MAYKIVLAESATRAVIDDAGGELSRGEAVEMLECYRDRVTVACNRAIATIERHETARMAGVRRTGA